MKNRVHRLAILGATLLVLFFVCACSSGGGDDSSSDGTGTTTDSTTEDAAAATARIDDLAIGVSNAYVNTDNSGAITIYASAVDDENVAVSGAIVDFSATGGVLSASTATTDETGIAEVTFSSGYLDMSNRQVVITAKANGLTVQAPISITGTTCTATAEVTSLVIGGDDSDTLTIIVTDAGGTPIYDTEVNLSVAAGSTGSVSFSAASGRTDVNGSLEVTVTAASPGTAIVSVSAAGATATEEYTAAALSTAMAITSPSVDPASMATDETLTIIASDPAPGASNKMVLATTVGTLSYGGQSGTSVTLDVVNGQVQATLSSTESGLATITAYDIDSPSTTDSVMVAIYAPVADATRLTLKAASSVVALSTGEITNTDEITAEVVNANDDAVGGAPVVFAISDNTGGGEFIAPSVVYTDASGTATTTLTSGTKSSGGEGITVTAYLLSDTSIENSVSIVIGGTAGSVVIGHASKIAESYDATAYEYSVSVIVADTNGNPIENALVSLNLWPKRFAVAEVVEVEDEETGEISYVYDNLIWYLNEDVDRNTYLDADEIEWYPDGRLTPGNSVAGTIPATVTTDEFGVGTVTWNYLKIYGRWIEVDITASTYVLGDLIESTLNVTPPIMEGDQDDLPAYPPWYILSE